MARELSFTTVYVEEFEVRACNVCLGAHMIFTYWDGPKPNLARFLRDWRAIDPHTKVFGDTEVLPILTELESQYAKLFQRIRLASCKSDIARWALLYRYGGFYVDAHGGSQDLGAFARIIGMLAEVDLVLFDEVRFHKFDGDLHVLNGALCGRQRAPVMAHVLSWLFENLAIHAAAEDSSKDYIPYNVFALTGAWAVAVKIFDYGVKPVPMRPEYIRFVHRERLAPDLHQRPFLWYKYYSYRKSHRHWSERQQRERLFTRPTKIHLAAAGRSKSPGPRSRRAGKT